VKVQKLFDLTGETALITGGTGKLGYQMATALAEAGATIVIASRDRHSCEKAAKSIEEETGARTMALQMDVTNAGQVSSGITTVKEKLGRIDILVNNAGIAKKALLDTAKLEDWRAVIETNLTSVFLCSQTVARLMIERKKGKIINIASIYGIVGVDYRLYEESPDMVPGSVPYTASKGGVINLTRDMAVYLAPHNIQVNAISPGGFKADQAESFIERYCYRTPLGRMGGENDLKGAIVLLASKASDYITGHNLVVDGGWTAW
jgi:NAD(P)-dependent dehydrogenase (short-subunit alcohol dehydrogenase family)